MAELSSPPTPSSSITSSFSHIVTTKLTTENYLLWKVQTTAYLRGQDLFSFVDGSSPSPPEFISPSDNIIPKLNLAFLAWRRTDQLVLSILFSSLSESVLTHVLSSTTARQLWNSIFSMFSSHSQAKDFQISFQLANLSRGEQTISDYFGKVRHLADSIASNGSPLSDKELVTYLLNGLGPSYEFFVLSITTRTEPISFNELYQLLLIHETRLSHNTKPAQSSFEPSVNLTTANRDQRGRNFFRGGRQGRSRGRYPYNGRVSPQI
ncbi:hypothetical protein F2P56_035852 [Juglans regia]|uniref:Retrotransposon Copia-like N-terminal domain-containing protein n=1 Tax=Juglans regia TaxID=51240 RepID=A0A833TUN4_JUGRE|nr:hypothetical protein F2P56_035852 [Juglans regia]